MDATVPLRRHGPDDAGFTLVEIVIAIVLVGVLSAVVVVGVGALTEQGNAASCTTSADAARAGAKVHWAASGAHPGDLNEMVAGGALDLGDGVDVDDGGRFATGAGWTLSMLSAGTSVAPVFMCSTDVPDGYSMGPNGHLYRVIPTPASWAAASAAAQATSVDGVPGYLATITSDSENRFVAGMTTLDLWYGGSDAAAEGDWRWVTGPEAGTAFWSGAVNGSSVSGAFVRWRGAEPNDNVDQDCLRRTAGYPTWDDANCWVAYPYVIEIGG